MSVEDSKIIDLISTDPEGNVVLTISDHLEWDEKLEDHIVLQNKINDYLSFIEGGQLFIDYPAAMGKKIIIGIFVKFIPDETAEKFLKMAKETIQSAGFDLKLSFIQEQRIK
jgi:hypothetical protein